MARFCGAGTAQPPNMRIKYMFIVQRYVYRAKVRLMPADAGGVLHRECGVIAIVGAMRKFRVGWRPERPISSAFLPLGEGLQMHHVERTVSPPK